MSRWTFSVTVNIVAIYINPTDVIVLIALQNAMHLIIDTVKDLFQGKNMEKRRSNGYKPGKYGMRDKDAEIIKTLIGGGSAKQLACDRGLCRQTINNKVHLMYKRYNVGNLSALTAKFLISFVTVNSTPYNNGMLISNNAINELFQMIGGERKTALELQSQPTKSVSRP